MPFLRRTCHVKIIPLHPLSPSMNVKLQKAETHYSFFDCHASQVPFNVQSIRINTLYHQCWLSDPNYGTSLTFIFNQTVNVGGILLHSHHAKLHPACAFEKQQCHVTVGIIKPMKHLGDLIRLDCQWYKSSVITEAGQKNKTDF